MNKEIKLIRLISGEQLMAKVDANLDDAVILSNVTVVLMLPSKTSTSNQPSVGLAPWMEFSSDKSVTIDKRHVIAIMTPIKEFVDQHNQIFGGIITGPKLILPQ